MLEFFERVELLAEFPEQGEPWGMGHDRIFDNRSIDRTELSID